VRTLVIEYYDNAANQPDKIYITVDERDLELLSEVLSREAIKTKALKGVVKDAKSRLLDIT
jgi:hypothetical protein